MKLFFSLSVFTILFSVGANAQVANTQIDPLASAYKFCANMSFSDDKQACVGIVNRAQFFDDNGLSICSKVSMSSDKLSCVSAVADKMIDPILSAACKGLSFSDDLLACARIIGNKFARSEAAVSACKTIAMSSDRLNCIRSVAVDQPSVVVVPQPASLCNARELRTVLDNSIADLRAARFTSALRGLTNLSALIDVCFR